MPLRLPEAPQRQLHSKVYAALQDDMTDRSEEYAQEVAERIVSARKESGLTQVELAELVGVSNRSMQGYENAEVIPYRKMKDLARVLNVPVEYLLHGGEAITPAEKQFAEIQAELAEIKKMLSRRK